jgi:hypothetical protein
MAAPALSESLTGRLNQLKPQAPAGLVTRARSAAVASPAPDGLRARRQRRLRNRLLLTVAAIAVIAANGAAAYFLPSYAIALGKIPGAGTLLGWSGLSASDVSVLYATTQHNGVGLAVTAGFAGDSATVLTIEVSGPHAIPGTFNAVSLTDQFGHAYPETTSGDSVANLPDGATPDVLTFAPLTGPAAFAGARLTLQADDWASICACRDSGAQQITGAWQVTFVLERHPGHQLTWGRATMDGVTYTFPDVTITGNTLVQLQIDGTGPAVEAMVNRDLTIPAPQLEDSRGHVVAVTRVPEVTYHATNDRESFFLTYIVRAGRYRLFVYGADGSSVERDFVVG